MGFLPNIFKIKAADIVPNIVTLGQYGLVKGSLVEARNVALPALRSLYSAISPAHAPLVSPTSQFANYYQQQPYYTQPTYGGAPWDYSTPSPTFSALPPNFQGADYSIPSLGFSEAQWPEGFSR